MPSFKVCYVCGVQVIGLLVEMLNTVIRILLRGVVPVGEDLQSWESVGFHCKNLETTVNDLVAGDLQNSHDIY
jgi:hypothetical protein